MFHLSLLQVVFSKYTDLLPKEILNEDAPGLQRPDEEAVKEVNHTVTVTQFQSWFIFNRENKERCIAHILPYV